MNLLKIGRVYVEIDTLEDAVAIWTAEREAQNYASSDAPYVTACVNKKLYRISYNGRVWDPNTNLEVPMPGRKTAAQYESENWNDYRNQPTP